MSADRRFCIALLLTLLMHGLAISALGLLHRENEPVRSPTRAIVEVALFSEMAKPDVTARTNDVTARTNDVTARTNDVTARTNDVTARTNGRTTRSVRAPEQTHLSAEEGTAGHDSDARSMQIVTSDVGEDTSLPQAQNDNDTGQGNQSGDGRDNSPLTRKELGLGIGDYSAVLPKASPVQSSMQSRMALSRKLDQSMRQDAAEHDATLGLGEEGPILKKLEQLTLRSLVDLSGSATVRARLLSDGKVEFELEGSTNDRAAWNRLLAQAGKELSAQSLKPPKGSQGLELVIRIDSRIQMPSGADPGFGVKMFGLTLREGEGKRSSKLEILSRLPSLKLDDSAATKGEKGMTQRLEMEIMRLALDPADLSGKRSRVTSARVISRKLL